MNKLPDERKKMKVKMKTRQRTDEERTEEAKRDCVMMVKMTLGSQRSRDSKKIK